MLKGYEDYRLGAGSEVMEWIKEQSRHRRCLERKRVIGSEKRLDRAQTNSLIVALSGILVAAATAYFNAWVGAVTAIVAVGGPSTATVIARILDKVNRKN
jgi:hypothetical protein